MVPGIKLYVTEVTLPAGCRLEIGHTLEAGVSIESVTLNGEATDYEVRFHPQRQ